MKQPNSRMITLARESRQLTQTSLCRKAGITQGALSKIEGGVLSCPDDVIQKIAYTLDYPIKFFYQDIPIHGIGTGAHHCMYRRRASVSVKALKRIEAEVNIKRMNIASLLSAVDLEHSKPVPRIDPSDYADDIEQIARSARIYWELPSGPVGNVTELLEGAGVLVIEHDFGTDKIDATSIRREDLPPLIFIRKSMPGDRLRFTLAHELGHLIMHDLPHPKIESEADRFASEFLMPAADIGPSLARLDLVRAARLKPYWKASMASIIYRAKSLGRLTDNQYRYLFYQLSAAGYRTSEPKELEVPVERPSTHKELLSYFRSELGYSNQELADLFLINKQDFDKFYTEREQTPYLRAVQ